MILLTSIFGVLTSIFASFESGSRLPLRRRGRRRRSHRQNQVLDDDIASPAQLSKAYMGTVPSKDLVMLSSGPNLSKFPIMALVPRSSGHIGIIENGFVMPRC